MTVRLTTRQRELSHHFGQDFRFQYARKCRLEHYEFLPALDAFHRRAEMTLHSAAIALPALRVPAYDQARRPDPDCPYPAGNITSIFFTIGHSTRMLEEFVDLLRKSSIELVVDVRSMPRSRTNPQFNLETFPNKLAHRQIGYAHIAELGGLRGKQRILETSPNASRWAVTEVITRPGPGC